MKRIQIVSILGVILLGITVVTMRPAKADPQPRKREYITLQAQEFYFVVGDKFQFGGFYVYNYGGSAGAPKLILPTSTNPYEVGTNYLDHVLADLDSRGYEVYQTDGRIYNLRTR